MVDAPKKTPKRVAGLGLGAWGGILGGGLFVVWYLRRRSAASQAAAATGTTDANTEPASSTGSSTSTAAPSTLSQWISDALGSVTNATYTPTQALNDINDWLSGQCVSSGGYSALGSLVATLGVPPGYTTLPPITVCAGSGGAAATGSPDTPSSPFSVTGTGSGSSTSSAVSSTGGGSSAIQAVTGGSGTDEDPFTLAAAATSADLNAIANAVNTSSNSVTVSNGAQTFSVQPGQSISSAAAVAAAPVVDFEQQYGMSPQDWQANNPGQPLPAVNLNTPGDVPA